MKKAPAKRKQTKKTPVAVTDTNWEKLEQPALDGVMSYPTNQKFPHSTFPFRLDIKKENRVCWFQCEEHMNKLIDREKLTPKDYQISTNGVEIVGKSTRRKRRKQ